MRYFTYIEPAEDTDLPVYVVVSEDDIRRDFYPGWLKKMNKKFGEAHVQQTYAFPDCVDDWMTDHWAWESTP